jgi:hypothetical protein
MLNLIFLLYIYVSNQNNWNDLERNSNANWLKRITNFFKTWEYYIHLFSFMLPFSTLTIVYVIRKDVFQYDDILKKCDFHRLPNLIIVTSFDSIILGLNLILIAGMFYKKINTKHYNQSELPPCKLKMFLIKGLNFFP